MNYKQKYIPWFCLVRLVCVWCMSVYLLILYVLMCVQLHVWACVYGGQGSILYVFLQHSPPYSLRQDL